jgi:hypothetical protein
MKYLIVLVLLLNGCARITNPCNMSTCNAPTIGPSLVDGSIVRATALVEVASFHTTAWHNIFFSNAYAASTATTVVTYNNAPSVTFTINAAALVAGSFTGDTLSLGSFTITALKDNHLNVCNPGGNTKCTTAILRVYTTGATAGFVNTSASPQYGNNVFTTGENPATALPLSSPGVAIQTLSGMASSKHTVKLSDFSPTTFSVTSDFANGGDGLYSMSYVVEYALAP